MIIELTEEEREFLVRIFLRAKMLSMMNLAKEHPFDADGKAIEVLLEKLEAKK